MLYLFVQEKIVPYKLYEELEKSKERRINIQYYIKKAISDEEVVSDIKSAKQFLLQMEKIIEEITDEQIMVVRERLRRFL